MGLKNTNLKQREVKKMENRNHKDSLFIDLFCKDKEGKQNFISLYNALHNTNLDLATTTVQEVNIENVLYMALSNDIAMLVDNRLVVLVNTNLQSTKICHYDFWNMYPAFTNNLSRQKTDTKKR